MPDLQFMAHTLMRLFSAVPKTLELFGASIALGGIIALFIVWLRVSKNRILASFANAYIFVFRGSPLLIQMFLIYYGLAQFSIVRLSVIWPLVRQPFICAVVALALCTGAYTAEIFRMGLRTVSPMEIEAARALGMSRFLLLRRIIGPIAIRHALPAYSTELVLMIKSTALASLVTVWEVTGVAQRLIAESYKVFEVFTCAGLIYLLLNLILLQILGVIETRLSRHRRAGENTKKHNSVWRRHA